MKEKGHSKQLREKEKRHETRRDLENRVKERGILIYNDSTIRVIYSNISDIFPGMNFSSS
jgi:hypothetical protein